MKKPLIVKIGEEKFSQTDGQNVHLAGDKNIDKVLNDLEKTPHAFVLACLMDRQIKAERAWTIPVKIFDIVGTSDIDKLLKVDVKEYQKIFNENSLHRFNDTMAWNFYSALSDIKINYDNNAAKIWRNKPSSATVVYRFLEFYGSGIKISTMAANILARQFKIEFSDYCSIDISPDVHIKRVLARMGYVKIDASNEKIIYKARELNPEFPGIIDFSLWEIGRKYCRPNNPDCNNCIVNSECKKEYLIIM
jgi:endonuclease III